MNMKCSQYTCRTLNLEKLYERLLNEEFMDKINVKQANTGGHKLFLAIAKNTLTEEEVRSVVYKLLEVLFLMFCSPWVLLRPLLE